MRISVDVESFLKSLDDKKKKGMKKTTREMIEEANPDEFTTVEKKDEPKQTVDTDTKVEIKEITPKEKQGVYDYLDKLTDDYGNNKYRTYDGNIIYEYDKKEYNPLSDDEIEKIATDTFKEKYDMSKEKLTDENDIKVNKIEKSKSDATETADEKIKRLIAEYGNAVKSVEDQALKRGIGRSSIVVEQINDLNSKKINAVEDVYDKLNKDIKAYDDDINALDDALNKAIKNLDFETAVKINDKIDELKEKRQKEMDEVKAYNDKMQKNYEDDLRALNEKGISTKEEDSAEYKKLANDKFKTLYSFYAGYGKDAIKEILKDRDMIEKQLGTSGFKLLKGYFD